MPLLLLFSGPPLPAAGGFRSAVSLGPGGLGSAPTTLNLAQSSNIGIDGTVGTTGTFLWKQDIAASTVAITGETGITGNFSFLSHLDLATTAAVGITGTVETSGTFLFKQDIVPSTISVSGVLGSTGNITIIAPVIGFPSAVVLWPYGFGSGALNLSSSAIAVTGTIGATGDIGITKRLDLSQTAAASVTGSFGIAGTLAYKYSSGGFRSSAALWPGGFGVPVYGNFNIAQTADVAVSGAVSSTGTFEFITDAKLDILTTAAVGIDGAVGTAGNLGYGINWEFEPPLELTLISGAASITGDFAYTLPKFDLSQTGEIPFVGEQSITGAFSYLKTHDIGAGLAAVIGTVGTAGNFEHQENAKLDIQPTAVVAIDGVLSAAGDVGWTIDLVQSGALSVEGTVQSAGDIRTPTVHDILITLPLSLSGTVQSAGNISIRSSKLDITQSGEIGVTGTVASSGNIASTDAIKLDFVTSVLMMAGTMEATGDMLAANDHRFTALGRGRIGKEHAKPDSRIGRATLLGGVPRVGSGRQ